MHVAPLDVWVSPLVSSVRRHGNVESRRCPHTAKETGGQAEDHDQLRNFILVNSGVSEQDFPRQTWRRVTSLHEDTGKLEGSGHRTAQDRIWQGRLLCGRSGVHHAAAA